MPVRFYCPKLHLFPWGRGFAILATIPGGHLAAGNFQEEMVSLELAVRYSGDVAIIDLVGRIVLNDGSATVRESIAKLREEGANKILLNLAGVSFMDSSGLGELASAYAGVKKSGGQMK